MSNKSWTTSGKLGTFAVLLLLCGSGWLQPAARGQTAPAAVGQRSAADEAARRQILESERWRQARRGLNEWLSIQKLYSPEEVAVLKRQFQARIERMSASELQDQLDDMEAKLAVLSSPEAEDARRWLAQFLAVQAKYTPAQLRARRPDVANMTASQIRQELAKFQQRRGNVQQTQATAQQGRSLQLQNAQNVQAARQQAAQQARESASRSADLAAQRNQIPPPGTNLPGHSEPTWPNAPVYTVGPWGNPILWDPRVGFW
jgi:hypothetical protein